MDTVLTARAALRAHWPEYLIEAWALGTFMVSAGVFATAFQYPDSSLFSAMESNDGRRVAIGVAMGLTAIGLIYSPWGRRSGAHMNPAVTVAFWSLDKIAGWDALFYVFAQVVGGLCGVLAVLGLLGPAFAAPPVSYVATVPGEAGVATAFFSELGISLLLMTVVLITGSIPRLRAWTGVIAGIMVATFIAVEAPLSGMSMNPARTLASAIPSHVHTALWIYLTAPTIGMWLAARAFSLFQGRCAAICAKLQTHSVAQRCIHCGYAPPAGSTKSTIAATKGQS